MVATTKSKPKKSKKSTNNAPAGEHGLSVLKEKYKGAQQALDKFDRKSEVLQQEGRIEQAQQSFIEIVEALHVIEEQGLYRYLADSMTEYARLRWGWGSATVTRHKNAYLVLQAVEKFDVHHSMRDRPDSFTSTPQTKRTNSLRAKRLRFGPRLSILPPTSTVAK